MGTLYTNSGGSSTNSGSTDTASATLEGSSLATVVADDTVDAVGTNQLTVTGHAYTSGMGVELTTSGTLPTGLSAFILYFVYVIDANTISLHLDVAGAEAGTGAVSITAASGSGTHTLNCYTLKLGESVDLSSVIVNAFRVTTTGTSHVCTMLGGVHGMSDGDQVFFQIASGGTVPTGLTSMYFYYVNVLSTTNTFRLYPTSALAIAGGASTINVSTAGTCKATLRQDDMASVYIDQLSNSNRKIAWIRAVSDTNNLLILDLEPTLSSSPTDWRIGGQQTSVGTALDACIGMDTCLVGSNVSVAGTVATFRTSGALPQAPVKLIGKTGSRPSLTCTNTSHCVLVASGIDSVYMENLEIIQQGATGDGIHISGSCGNGVFRNLKITDAGSYGIQMESGSSTLRDHTFIDVEIACGGSAVGIALAYYTELNKCSIHNNGSHGVSFVRTDGIQVVIDACIIAHNGGVGIAETQSLSGLTSPLVIRRSIIYGNSNSGLEVTHPFALIFMQNNIFANNGDASGEYNIEFTGIIGSNNSSTNVWENNCYFQSAAVLAAGAVNLLNFTAASTDVTTDPLLVDPDNATVASRNFGIGSSSPCKATGTPGTWLGYTGTTGYLDMGAVQRQEPAGGAGGLMTHPGMSGGMRG